MAILTNAEVMAIGKKDPDFKKWTAKQGADLFSTNGYKSFKNLTNNDKEDFFNNTVRVFLEMIKTPDINVRDPFNKIVHEFGIPFGGIAQRMRTYLMKPENYKGRGLVNGSSVDPYVVRKPEVSEDFWRMNFDYANHVTIQDANIRQMFTDPSGITTLLGGIMYGFDIAKDVQERVMLRYIINEILNDATTPLKSTQKVTVPDLLDASADDDDIRDFLMTFKNLAGRMKDICFSDEFNTDGYEHGLNLENYVLYVRDNVNNKINVTAKTTAFRTEYLDYGFPNVEFVTNFGAKLQKASDHSAVVPIYSTEDYNKGSVLGFNTSGQTSPLAWSAIEQVDANPLIDAVLIEKGAILKGVQNGYEVNTIFNPAGNYLNYWARQINKMYGYDASYDIIVFSHPAPDSNKKSNAKKDEK